MEILTGSIRFGLWFVQVSWQGESVYRIAFTKSGTSGPTPPVLRQYLSGQKTDPTVLSTPATEEGFPYATVYRVVRGIPYGCTATYGEIARSAGTFPRVVGLALARNPTPLVVPCHRVVGARGLGGFTPHIEIKEALLSLEKEVSGLSALQTGCI
ncbi:MAG: MGMT family protein [Methanomicrobiales archaeon]|nr:MGMT family protein [Methanomicrobiales archaeon]MDI6875154.1 MGMT family protein [Methanomicrobiales archaeon]